jgi:high frequency lysogenization protein
MADQHYQQQVLSLAAAVQALVQVLEIARRGRPDSTQVQTCLAGLLQPYEGDIARLYGSSGQLRFGLRVLVQQLSHPRDTELTRHLIAALHLERRLQKNSKFLSRLANGLEQARRQVNYFDSNDHPGIVCNLADLYSETISTMKPRIVIHGERQYLEQNRNVELIRALLLSAVRAISLWRTNGGSRCRLLLYRSRLIHEAQRMLQEFGGV